MCSLLAVLFPFFTEFRQLHLIGALIVTGVLIDLLVLWLTGNTPATPVRARNSRARAELEHPRPSGSRPSTRAPWLAGPNRRRGC